MSIVPWQVTRTRPPRRHDAVPQSRPRLNTFTQLVAGGTVLGAAFTAHSIINWQVMRRHPKPPFDPDGRPTVSVLIDATDPDDQAAKTIRSLLEQEDVQLDIVVWRPASRVPSSLNELFRKNPEVTVVQGCSTGRCDQAQIRASLAKQASGEVLIFCDPDVVFEPNAVRTFVDMVVGDDLDVLCAYPRQRIHDFWGSLLAPLRLWGWATYVPLLLAERSLSDSLTVGAGHVIVCRADTYRSSGGYDRIPPDADGGAISRSFSSAGLTAAVADAARYATHHDEVGWKESARVTRSGMRRVFKTRPRTIAAMTLFATVNLLPFVGTSVGVARRDHRLMWWGGTGVALSYIGRGFVTWRSRGQVRDVIAHPLAAATIVYLGLTSMRHTDDPFDPPELLDLEPT